MCVYVCVFVIVGKQLVNLSEDYMSVHFPFFNRCEIYQNDKQTKNKCLFQES